MLLELTPKYSLGTNVALEKAYFTSLISNFLAVKDEKGIIILALEG